MSFHDQGRDITTLCARSDVAHRQIVATLIMVADEQTRLWQERGRLTEELQALAREDAVLAQRRARLIDELQASAGLSHQTDGVPSGRSDGDPVGREQQNPCGYPDLPAVGAGSPRPARRGLTALTGSFGDPPPPSERRSGDPGS